MKGLISAALGRDEEAIKLYNLALELNPRSEHAHYNLGLAYRGAGNLADAIKSFRTTIEISPTFFMAHNNLGNIYISTKDLSAIKALGQHLRSNPELFILELVRTHIILENWKKPLKG